MTLVVVLLQTLLSVPVDGAPVRVGVPLPAAVVEKGLHLAGRGALQWRRLPIGGPEPNPVWIELAIAGARGEAAVVAGGEGPSENGRGPAFVREVERRDEPFGAVERTTWRWCDGASDEVVRTTFRGETTVAGETWTPGESLTTASGGAATRCEVLARLPRRHHVTAGLLPPPGRAGAVVRKQVAAMLPRLRELPGVRGAGDFGRSGGVVTNLEFDTTLALLRAALECRDTNALAKAVRCAHHLIDRDLDALSGLPFPHGQDHRTGRPEPGHAWLQGVLWVGLVTADDRLLSAARGLGHAIAAAPPPGEGRLERARDVCWPLLEMEALLAVEPDPVVAAAADRLAAAIGARHDPVARTFRFGEGEVGDGVYFERAWITGGVVLPALVAHLRRAADPVLEARVRDVQQALLEHLEAARPGVPTHWRTADGRWFAEHRAPADPGAVLMLEGLPPADVRRLAQREIVRGALDEVLQPDDPDLATSFTIVARCRWIWQ